jgi:hypothetical protein
VTPVLNRLSTIILYPRTIYCILLFSSSEFIVAFEKGDDWCTLVGTLDCIDQFWALGF